MKPKEAENPRRAVASQALQVFDQIQPLAFRKVIAEGVAAVVHPEPGRVYDELRLKR